MLEIGIIADDLTGAAESGAAFLPAYSDVRLVGADDLAMLPAGSPAPVLAVDTHSRALAAAQARQCVELAAGRLKAWRPAHVFKKIDSCLRGNLGAEADAVIDTMDLPISFIVPSYPEMGRITVGDIHYVNGEPVADSEFGRNADERVPESRLTLAVAVQSRHPVGHIDIDTLAAGEQALRRAVEQLAAKGVRHIVFDAAERQHLTAVAALGLKHFPSALLVGSAGLAAALCEQLPPAPAPSPAPVPTVAGHHLIALGTASCRARYQVAVLQQVHPAEMVTLDPVRLADAEAAPDAAVLAGLVEALTRGDVVACIAGPRSKDWSRMAQRVANGFGALIAAAAARIRPASLFLSGGDTAFAVLRRLGIHQLKLERMIVSGLVLSTAVGGPFRGLAVGTKPGAFGDDDALLRWRNAFA